VAGEAVSRLRENGTLSRESGDAASRAIAQGRPLSEALAGFPDEFPPEDIAVIEAGEAIGRLDENLETLAHLHDARRQAKRRMLTQALYPICLAHIAAVLLPVAHLAVAQQLSLFNWLRSVATILLPLWGLFFLFRWLSRSAVWRQRFRIVLDLVPGFGAAARHRRRALFATVLEAAYQGGVPVDRSLSLAARAAGEPGAVVAVKAVEAGEPLTGALTRTRIFPTADLSRIATGEEAGEISRVLHHIATEEEAAAEAVSKRSMVALGMIISLVVMGWIAWSVISFYLTLYGPVLNF